MKFITFLANTQFVIIVSVAITLTTASLYSMEQLEAVDYQQQIQLFQAARSGDYKNMVRLIDARADVRAADEYGKTALMEAVRGHHLESVRVLIQAKADVNYSSGNTALLIAARFGGEDCARALIQAKADVNFGRPLLTATRFGGEKCVRALIEAKADVNDATDEGETALMKAANNQSYGCADALIAARADVNRMSRRGETALSIAEMRNCLEICELIVERLLFRPGEKEIKSISAVLTCVNKCYGRDIMSLLARAFRDNEIYWYNRRNFAQSIAGQAVTNFSHERIKVSLQEKYLGPQGVYRACLLQFEVCKSNNNLDALKQLMKEAISLEAYSNRDDMKPAYKRLRSEISEMIKVHPNMYRACLLQFEVCKSNNSLDALKQLKEEVISLEAYSNHDEMKPAYKRLCSEIDEMIKVMATLIDQYDV